MIRAIYFYRETFSDGSDEILTICKACASKAVLAGDNLELIDRAKDISEECCKCEAQNVPDWYSPKPAFMAGTIN